MQIKFIKSILTLAFSAGVVLMSNNAMAGCTWVHGYWHNGYYHRAHQVCRANTYYHRCRWVNGVKVCRY